MKVYVCSVKDSIVGMIDDIIEPREIDSGLFVEKKYYGISMFHNTNQIYIFDEHKNYKCSRTVIIFQTMEECKEYFKTNLEYFISKEQDRQMKSMLLLTKLIKFRSQYNE